MNIRDAVAYLAANDYRCSAATVRNLVRAGKLRCFRPGVSGKGRMEFSPLRLDEFLCEAEGVSEPPRPKSRPKRSAPRKTAETKPSDWRDRLRKVIQS